MTVGFAAEADEFGPLIVLEEARALNGQWQMCATPFIKRRPQSDEIAERLAEQALDQCRASQNSLNPFLIERMGGTRSSNVVAFLRERYQSGLTAVIADLRARKLSRSAGRMRTS